MNNKLDIERKVRNWIDEAQRLPIIPWSYDLFAPKNDREYIINFFEDVLKHLHNPKFANRVFMAYKEMDCTTAWRTLNAGGHPVRDGLILLGIGLDIE